MCANTLPTRLPAPENILFQAFCPGLSWCTCQCNKLIYALHSTFWPAACSELASCLQRNCRTLQAICSKVPLGSGQCIASYLNGIPSWPGKLHQTIKHWRIKCDKKNKPGWQEECLGYLQLLQLSFQNLISMLHQLIAVHVYVCIEKGCKGLGMVHLLVFDLCHEARRSCPALIQLHVDPRTSARQTIQTKKFHIFSHISGIFLQRCGCRCHRHHWNYLWLVGCLSARVLRSKPALSNLQMIFSRIAFLRTFFAWLHGWTELVCACVRTRGFRPFTDLSITPFRSSHIRNLKVQVSTTALTITRPQESSSVRRQCCNKNIGFTSGIVLQHKQILFYKLRSKIFRALWLYHRAL